MNRDNIIDWVTQVDMSFLKRTEPWNMFDKYEAFAALVASAERQECAKLCEAEADDGTEGEWDGCCLAMASVIRAKGADTNAT